MSRTAIRALMGQFTAALVGVVATALVMGGGFAFAQTAPDPGTGVAEALAGPNTVNSAVIIDGTVTGHDIANQTLGRADIKKGIAPLWARVSSNGALVRGHGVTSVERVAFGVYSITFNRDVRTCAWIATPTDNDAGNALPGFVTAERRSSADPSTLEVRTFSTAGNQADRDASDGFAVMVVC